MPKYRVSAIDASTGTHLTERFDADTEDQARAHFASRGLTVLQVDSGMSLGANLQIGTKRIKVADLAEFTRKLSTMINAGLSILKALSILGNQTSNPTLRSTLRRVQADVEGGDGLAKAMSKHDQVFPPVMIAMIRSAEAGGYLARVLLELSTMLEKNVKLRKQIKTASTYPLITLGIAVVGVVAMLVFIVPVFVSMFDSLGGQLPLATRLMVSASQGLKVAGIPLVLLIVAGISWWRRVKNRPAVRAFVDPLKLRIPVVGPKLIAKLALARFCRNLSIMLNAGVPLMSALNVVADTADNTVVRDVVLATAKHLEAGDAMSDHLGDGGVFDDMVVQMVAIGEESGDLSQMLAKAADYYDDDVESAAGSLSSTLEPLMVVLMSTVVGSMVIALYMPMFSIYNLIN